MAALSTWESLLLGAMALLVIFWMSPGIKAAVTQSKTAKSDWLGFFIPIAAVVALVLVLIAMVK